MKEGWEAQSIASFAKTGAGGTPKKSTKAFYEGGNIPWLLSGEVANANIVEAKNSITPEGLKGSSAKLFPANSVLVAMYGATAGQVGILRFEAATNQAVCAILPSDQHIPEYLYYYLLHAKPSLVAQAVGNAQPNISQAKIKSLEIPLPPLEEQQRIVAVLDEAFEGLARARAHAEANLQNARELLAVSLDQIFGCDDPSWKTGSLSELCVIGDGNHSSKYPKKSEMVNEGIPFLRSSNIQNGEIDQDEMLYITEEKHAELKKGHLKAGDVLFTNRGEIGKVAIIPEDLEGANLNSQVAWLRCKAEIEHRFLFYFLQSGRMKRHYLDTQSGAALQQFTIKMLKAVSVSYPSHPEQEAAVVRIETIQNEISRLVTAYQSAAQGLDDLRQSLLQKAFAGELT